MPRGESSRTVVKRGQFEKKFMLTLLMFFKSDGPMHVPYLNNGETINYDKLY